MHTAIRFIATVIGTPLLWIGIIILWFVLAIVSIIFHAIYGRKHKFQFEG